MLLVMTTKAEWIHREMSLTHKFISGTGASGSSIGVCHAVPEIYQPWYTQSSLDAAFLL